LRTRGSRDFATGRPKRGELQRPLNG